MLGILIREKPSKVLLALKNAETQWHMSKLARQAGVTYVHLTELIPKMQELGLVKTEKTGKKNIVTLTEKGLEIAQLLEEIKRKMETPKEATVPKQP